MDKGRLNKIVSKMLETLLEGITIRDYMNKSKELEDHNFFWKVCWVLKLLMIFTNFFIVNCIY
jgi:hypothetical protein